jgi:uncharacterized membrane-anchored protein
MSELRPSRFAIFVLSASLLLALSAAAQPQGDIQWEDGPTKGKLGSVAEITIPEGYRFAGKSGAQRVLELTHNPTSGNELGVIIPNTKDKDLWFLIFEFEETGFIKDEEKDSLDAAAILKSLQEGTEASNKLRAEKGWSAVHVVGWEKPPFYDTRTNNLTWATRLRSDQGENLNYSVRILGRRGTMNIDLVISPDQLSTVLPAFENLESGFLYTQGSRYSDYVSGDKVASYGLTALVAGGAAAAATKSGLLAKFWKLIVAAVAAIAAAVKKFFRAIFGKKKEDEPGYIHPE